MTTQKIMFQDRESICVFSGISSNLAYAVSELQLDGNHPVIVLIGGEIEERYAESTRRAIQTISTIAEQLNAIIICGGTDMGVMAEIGQARWRNAYRFPLIGIAPEEQVTWPDGPKSTNVLWWGKKRWQLEPHYSHFMLVPGPQFGDESPWIDKVAGLLSNGYQSVTILINGGEVSRKDIELSLASARPVIALSRTGRLADEFAGQTDRNKLITIVPVNAEQRVGDAIQLALSASTTSFLPIFAPVYTEHQ